MQKQLYRPIYVIGCPRSGNTLLGAILNKHPDLYVIFEINTFYSMYRIWRHRCTGSKGTPQEEFSRLILKQFGGYNARFGIAAEDVVACVSQSAPQWRTLLADYMGFLIARIKPSAQRWGDKTPHHLGCVPLIQQYYPEAQFIYTYRDPRSVVNSLSKHSFTPATNSEVINAEVVRHYLETYKKQRNLANTSTIFEVQYENLVSDPEKTVREICAFLGVDYSPDLIEKADDSVLQIADWPEDKAWGKIEPQANHLPPEADYVEAYLADWIIQLGYKLRDIRCRRIKNSLVGLRTLPFRAARAMLSVRWSKKYPELPYLMLRFPSALGYIQRLVESRFSTS